MISFSRLENGISRGWGAINVFQFLSNIIFDMVFYVFSFPFIFLEFWLSWKTHDVLQTLYRDDVAIVMLRHVYLHYYEINLWNTRCFKITNSIELFLKGISINMATMIAKNIKKQYQHIHILRREAHPCVFFGGSFGCRNSPSLRLKHRSLWSFGGLEAPGESRLECQGGRQW